MYRNVTSEESKYKISDSKVAVMNSGNTYKSLKVFDIKIKNIKRGGQSTKLELNFAHLPKFS